jgi:hypothetical protein
MSDLQIITGISILISGYAQLRCGLSSYHWQVLVYLAWFSSITHLSCLTFLRNHLYNRPAERLWRLFFMGVMIVMLVTAIVPTGNFAFPYDFEDEATSGRATPSSYAVCSYGVSMPASYGSFSTMVISIILLVIGFASRIIKLHKRLSESGVWSLRKFSKETGLKFLSYVYSWSNVQQVPEGLQRRLLYRPCLTIFLFIRLLLDILSSMMFEVRFRTSL